MFVLQTADFQQRDQRLETALSRGTKTDQRGTERASEEWGGLAFTRSRFTLFFSCQEGSEPVTSVSGGSYDKRGMVALKN